MDKTKDNVVSRSHQQRKIPAASAEELHKRDVSRAATHSRALGSSRADEILLRRPRWQLTMPLHRLITAEDGRSPSTAASPTFLS